ncbi:hypothetical protein K7640_10530 [Micromonospora sp. PLK6-60]|uniref:hypothetical protein n=1 Tax=Micromonospora sp. PLK6-60 TaxID=2873383 RepID=UPI001CA72DD5|nr:hypothetical protein [Micromonospora sp. PLK6-60]MBY8872274.1 hypothetical protein [Micromonospora sp. PLK6-60]
MTTEPVPAPRSGSRPARWAYAWWAAVGALLGLGLAAILTIGPVLLLVGGVLAGAGVLLRAARNRSAVAVVGGLAAAPGYLAWLNRAGPGWVCETTATRTSCVQAWSPWPFLVVALLLVAATVFLLRRVRP